jgi:hypothetical protein
MRHVVKATLGAIFALALGGMAEAETRPVVVELYTSQGCSSCPPADAFFARLAGDPEVIALALHVDYWDYIGWKDTFGNPLFTKRQKAYAKASGSRMIYTPQIIVGGEDRVEGNDPVAVAELIRRHADKGGPVRLTVSRMGDRVSIRAEAQPPLDRAARVQLVRYTPERTVEIARGENAGRQVTYHNIVTEWRVLGDWSGREPLEIEADAPGAEPVVVLIQRDGPAAILAAARVK